MIDLNSLTQTNILMMILALSGLVVLSIVLKMFKSYIPALKSPIEVVGAANLTGKNKLFLVKFENKTLLVGSNENHISTLHVISKDSDVITDTSIHKTKNEIAYEQV